MGLGWLLTLVGAKFKELPSEVLSGLHLQAPSELFSGSPSVFLLEVPSIELSKELHKQIAMLLPKETLKELPKEFPIAMAFPKEIPKQHPTTEGN